MKLNNPALGETLQSWLADKGDPGITFFQVLLPNLITLSFIFASIIFFFMLVWGAITWILSGGDKGAIETARSRITNALIGIFILFAMFAIIRVIEVFFGISILTLDIGVLKIE